MRAGSRATSGRLAAKGKTGADGKKAVRFGAEEEKDKDGNTKAGKVRTGIQPLKMYNEELMMYLEHFNLCDTHSLQERRTQLNELDPKQWIYLLLHSNL